MKGVIARVVKGLISPSGNVGLVISHWTNYPTVFSQVRQMGLHEQPY